MIYKIIFKNGSILEIDMDITERELMENPIVKLAISSYGKIESIIKVIA